MLSEQEKQKVQEILAQMESPVTIHYFTQEFECEPCSVTHELLEVMTTLSDKLTLRTYEFQDEFEGALPEAQFVELVLQAA